MVAALSASEIQGAKFREGIRAAGGAVVGDSAVDQETLRRAGARIAAKAQDDRPGYVEIDAAEGERVIVITQRDGTVVELHPFLTSGSRKKMPFYARQLERFQAELDACDDEDRYMALLVRASELEEKLLRLAIPDLPTGFLDQLDSEVLVKLQEAGERLAQQRSGDADPNG